MLPVQEFNSTMQEIFLHSKRGAEKLNEIINNIIENKEREEFDDYMTAQSNEYPLMDDEYFSAEELICDSEE
jgi:predicted ester cyclase